MVGPRHLAPTAADVDLARRARRVERARQLAADLARLRAARARRKLSTTTSQKEENHES